MKKLFMCLCLTLALILPVSATQVELPEVPEEGELYMPDDTQSFGEAVWYVIKTAVADLMPQLQNTATTCLQIFAVMLLICLVTAFEQQAAHAVHLVGALLIGLILFSPANALIQLGQSCIQEITAYGQLLLPVLAGALASQGGVTASAALYAGTAFFSSVLSALISHLITPVLYLYLCVSLAKTAVPDMLLQNMQKLFKWLATWMLKIILYIFVGYMSITGVITGAADASAIRAVKLSLSGLVPVVGGILSEASETILVSAGVMKSAAGTYGAVALLSLVIGPFLRIGVRYLLLKATAALCSVFGNERESGLLKDFSTAMGIMLGMTGAVCLLYMISIVCFMKGVS